jgi:hypothetical protein
LKRSTRKKELKAKRQSKKRSTKRGFRKLVVDGDVYQWKVGDRFAEIRVPGKLNLKWVVGIWVLLGEPSETAWHTNHDHCCWDYCYHTGADFCLKYRITPGMVRKYIDEMRKASC